MWRHLSPAPGMKGQRDGFGPGCSLGPNSTSTWGLRLGPAVGPFLDIATRTNPEAVHTDWALKLRLDAHFFCSAAPAGLFRQPLFPSIGKKGKHKKKGQWRLRDVKGGSKEKQKSSRKRRPKKCTSDRSLSELLEMYRGRFACSFIRHKHT